SGTPRGFKQQHLRSLIEEGCFNPRPDMAPIEPSEAAAQRRDGNRTDVAAADLLDQRHETSVDVLDSARVPPVALGRKVDDVAGMDEAFEAVHHHPAGLKPTPIAE